MHVIEVRKYSEKKEVYMYLGELVISTMFYISMSTSQVYLKLLFTFPFC